MIRDREEQAKVFSIGSVVGGRTAGNRAWTDEIARLTSEVAAVRTGMEAPLNLNVVFHVAGHLIQPDFEGVRTGTFRKAQRLLMVQVALAEAAPAEPRAELLALLEDAVAEAEAWSLRRRVAFDREPFTRVLGSLAGR
ncbi:hypothetical protein [Cellulomonas palmilytica]|uniref:hypothetical protein n=1 Tax=Cellulomonas palmilytica TaxID=2608402 RepID=UPI001F2F00A8|nr:hypothetical protein [Cellulomonas palmilytica]UJP39786.1 hypothetical protein F1D97_16085 [Cellulomonas palmilytica]